MTTWVQLDADKAPTGCSMPTIVPALEFAPGQIYELPDDQAQALLALPDGPFTRASAKAARAQAAGTPEEAASATDDAQAPESEAG
jgi:hypothetical protein